MLGFSNQSDEISYETLKEKMLEAAKKTFKPEFLNRLDDLIVFRSLNKTDMSQIVHVEVSKVSDRLKSRSVKIDLSQEAIEFLIDKGYDPVYGARPLRRAVEKYLEDPIAEEILKGKIKTDQIISVGVKEGALTFETKENAPSQEAKAS
jgi:ATP-dependent Clp protease ATP-binding subunit ClpC